MKPWSKNDWSIEDIDAQLPQPRRCEVAPPERLRNALLLALVVTLVLIGTVGVGS